MATHEPVTIEDVVTFDNGAGPSNVVVLASDSFPPRGEPQSASGVCGGSTGEVSMPHAVTSNQQSRTVELPPLHQSASYEFFEEADDCAAAELSQNPCAGPTSSHEVQSSSSTEHTVVGALDDAVMADSCEIS
ncbi:hypothetical protein V6N12_043157 [Hibiscus sabdariffa]|uniref:Uncharacterized protein n=1 Tax=Hibiscus sabdariffa TaxID=183260 RepID=A0ABR2DDG9_9ROSI